MVGNSNRDSEFSSEKFTDSLQTESNPGFPWETCQRARLEKRVAQTPSRVACGASTTYGAAAGQASQTRWLGRGATAVWRSGRDRP